MQKPVESLIHRSSSADPLAESETTTNSHGYFEEHSVSAAESTRCVGLLERWDCSDVLKPLLELEPVDHLDMEDVPMAEI